MRCDLCLGEVCRVLSLEQSGYKMSCLLCHALYEQDLCSPTMLEWCGKRLHDCDSIDFPVWGLQDFACEAASTRRKVNLFESILESIRSGHSLGQPRVGSDLTIPSDSPAAPIHGSQEIRMKFGACPIAYRERFRCCGNVEA